MTKSEARRVAAYHSQNMRCTAFTERASCDFEPGVWKRHFEGDLRELRMADRQRGSKDERDAEVARIIAFLA